MGRGRFVIAVFVALCLALPPIADEAYAADTVVDCGFTSEVLTSGFDGSTQVATYKVRATWCIETTYETRTFTEDTSTGDEQVDKAKKSQKAKKGRRGKRRRRRGNRSSERSSTPTTRTERRAVSECITDFEIDADPQTLVNGADLIGVTTTQVPGGDPCATRSYRVVGRFGRDYVPGVPGLNRSVITERVAGITLENYPLGRLGHFDITVNFARDGGASCERCVPNFKFCDVRIVYDDDEAGCLHI